MARPQRAGRRAKFWAALGLSLLLFGCSDDAGSPGSQDGAAADSSTDANTTADATADAVAAPDADATPSVDTPETVGPEDVPAEPADSPAGDPGPDDATAIDVTAIDVTSEDVADSADPPDGDAADVDGTTDADDTSDTGSSASTDADVTADVADPDAEDLPDPCDQLAPLPLRWTKHGNLGGAEDYCLDNLGNMWAVSGGNLKKQTPDGTVTVVTPNLHGSAGTGCLSDGRIVVAIEDTLIVAWPTGGYITLLAGLEYPNGLDIDADDTIYVAEQSGGRVRAVDPNTGDFTVIADQLPAPNGVSFGPGYHRLYVGSFGGGWVHGINRKLDGTWGKPWVLARIDKDNTPVIDEPLLNVPVESDYDPCGTALPAAPCTTPDGWAGECVDTAWGPLCQRAADAVSPGIVACEGKAPDAVCGISILGEPFPGLCLTPETAPACCASSDEAGCTNVACEGCVCAADNFCCNVSWDGACANLAYGDCAGDCGCWAGGAIGGTGIEPLACYASFDPMKPCKHLDVGADCTLVRDSKSYFKGKCTNLANDPKPPPYAATGLGCVSTDLEGGGGGLDGLNVDACGNVYVTEYVLGYVWRIDPMGGVAKVVKLPNYWIPNMEFGRGVGGYGAESLYVIPINEPFLFELQAGVQGKEATMPGVP